MGDNEFDPAHYRAALDEWRADAFEDENENQESEWALILRFLTGWHEDDADGLPRRVYFAARSAEEHQAREALARLLLSDAPIHSEIRSALASLLAVSGPALAERRLIFEFRSRGARSNVARDFAISLGVYDLRKEGKTLEEAAAQIAEKYGLNDKHVQKLATRYKELCAIARDPIP